MVTIVIVGSIISCKESKNNINYVDPFIGTDGHGHTFPGASRPFGAIQLSPDTRKGNWDACSGYHYSDTTLFGFSHTHLSGTGVIDLGDVLFRPTTVNMINSDKEFTYPKMAKFSHDKEIASPGYYSVLLEEDNINVELTSSLRTGFHKYKFPNNSNKYVLIDLEHSLDDEHIFETEFKYESDHIISGMRRTRGWSENQVVYFVAEFSSDFNPKIIVGGVIQEFKKGDIIKSKNLKLVLDFSHSKINTIEAKVAISSTGYKGAKLNFESDSKYNNFNDVHKESTKIWSNILSKYNIKTNNEKLKKIFYTSVYHSYLAPYTYNDVDGSYRGMNKKIYNNKFTNYTALSVWDTYRTWNPLMTIMEPKLVKDIVYTSLARFNEVNELPIWPLYSSETGTMIGYHTTAVISEAIIKGIKGVNATEVYQSLITSSNKKRKGADLYRNNGFISANNNKESVSCLLEYCYDDWSIAQVAKVLGKNTDYKSYIERSQNFTNIFDGKTKFFRGKNSDGSFVSPFSPYKLLKDYTEATAWQYRFYVPHDINGLINQFGDISSFSLALDSLFIDNTTMGEMQDITGIMGQYVQGNEPSHHAAYLFNYIGEPWKTQKYVRELLTNMYSSKPDGIIGNEDMGQMSAWYIMSSMGLYPVAPATGEYVFGSPLFDQMKLKIGNSKTLNIVAHNNNEKNYYVDKILFNGEEILNNYISHKVIIKGGKLEFFMSSVPNYNRGTKKENFPYSFTTGKIVSTPYVNDDVSLFEDKVSVKLSVNTKDAEIYYTLDNTQPNKSKIKYNGEFIISKSTEIRAIAIKDNIEKSHELKLFAKKAKYLPSKTLNKKLKSGLKYKYYKGDFSTVFDIESLKPNSKGYVTNFRIDMNSEEDYFAYIFEGYIKVPESGVYSFYSKSDDGSVLFIDDVEVVNNDGSHSSIKATGEIALSKGVHKLKLMYFQSYEGKDLELGIKVPSKNTYEKISSEILYN